MKSYRSTHKKLLFAVFCLCLILFSCNLEKALQKDIDGLNANQPVRKLNGPADSLVRALTGNALMGLSDSSKKALDNIFTNLNGGIDKLKLDPAVKKLLSAISTMGDTTSLQITKIGNSVHWQIGKLQGDLTGTVNKLTTTLDKDAQKLVNDVIQSALNSANSAASKAKIDSIVSGVLDKNTDGKAQRLVSSALQPTIDTLSNRIDRIVHKDVPFVQKQAALLLSILAAIAIAIIGFVWYERSRYSRLVKILTYQIDKIQDPDTYTALTKSISSQSKDESLEPLLRKTLSKQGINP